ncbi:MAG: hypothetical protein KC493_03125 [Bacteriovoracaceae bacterium]|nr:hypothetical protein [Bacteriovoracaceae bacterium]
MSTYEEALSLISENKFSEALVVLEELTTANEESQFENIFYDIIKIKKMLNKESTSDKIRLAGILLEKRKYQDTINLLSTIKPTDNHSKKVLLKHFYRAQASSGQIQEAKKTGISYIEELLSLKKYHLVETFLPIFKKEIGDIESSIRYEIKSHVSRGDIDGLSFINIKEELEKFSRDEKINLTTARLLQDELDKYEKTFTKTEIYKFVRLVGAFAPQIQEEGDWGRKKRIINEVFDGVLKETKNPVYLRVLLKYALLSRRKNIAISTLQYLLDQKNELGIKRGEEKKFKSTLENVETWMDDKDKDLNFEDIDMGSDLFKEYNEGSNIFQRIKKLERDIDFMKSTGSDEDVRDLLEELRELDDEHTLVKVLNEEIKKPDSSRLKKKQSNLSEIRDDLLTELDKFKSKPNEDSDKTERYDRYFKIQVDHIDKNLFLNNRMDLVVALMEMKLYSAAEKCLERESNEDESLSDKLNRINLSIQILKDTDRFHEALDLCQETIANNPLTDEEKINFVYTEGELARKMKKNAQAVAAYKWVEMINPGYRLVKQRLKEFEQS